MKAHELAQKLLEGPDVIVGTQTWMDGEWAEANYIEYTQGRYDPKYSNSVHPYEGGPDSLVLIS